MHLQLENLKKKSEKYQLLLKQVGECCNGLPNLLEGGIVMVLSTLWACPPVPEMAEGVRLLTCKSLALRYHTPTEACEQALKQLAYYQSLEQFGHLKLVKHREDLPPLSLLPDEQRTCIHAILLMEGADPIVHPSDLPYWRSLGLQVIGLAWKGTRYSGGTDCPGPLTPLGRELITEMDKQGCILGGLFCKNMKLIFRYKSYGRNKVSGRLSLYSTVQLWLLIATVVP